jgi:hypothetical protein
MTIACDDIPEELPGIRQRGQAAALQLQSRSKTPGD